MASSSYDPLITAVLRNLLSFNNETLKFFLDKINSELKSRETNVCAVDLLDDWVNENRLERCVEYILRPRCDSSGDIIGWMCILVLIDGENIEKFSETVNRKEDDAKLMAKCASAAKAIKFSSLYFNSMRECHCPKTKKMGESLSEDDILDEGVDYDFDEKDPQPPLPKRNPGEELAMKKLLDEELNDISSHVQVFDPTTKEGTRKLLLGWKPKGWKYEKGEWYKCEKSSEDRTEEPSYREMIPSNSKNTNYEDPFGFSLSIPYTTKKDTPIDLKQHSDDSFILYDLSRYKIRKDNKKDGWPDIICPINPSHFPFTDTDVVISSGTIKITMTDSDVLDYVEYPLIDGGYLYHDSWGKAITKSTNFGWCISDFESYNRMYPSQKSANKREKSPERDSDTFDEKTIEDDGEIFDEDLDDNENLDGDFEEGYEEECCLSDYPYIEEIILSLLDKFSRTVMQDIVTKCCYIYINPPEEKQINIALRKLEKHGYVVFEEDIEEEAFEGYSFSISDTGECYLYDRITEILAQKLDTQEISYVSPTLAKQVNYSIRRQIHSFVLKNPQIASEKFCQIVKNSIRGENL